MKIYSKLLGKIRKNKARIKKIIGILTLAVVIRYGSINSSPTNLPSNSTQQIERVDTFVEEHTQDGKVQEGLSHKSSSRLIKTGSGVLIGNKRISEYSKSALEIRSGELGKSGPGPRAKADARRNAQAGKSSSGSTIIPGADGFVPQTTYCHYHENSPLSCKPKVKVLDSPFQDNGDDNQPPPENGNFDASSYKGGPNPFLDKFDYDNPNHTRENTDFSSQKRMNHAYDRHAKKCFNMKENRNKENLKEFEGKARSFIESPETEKINGSYRYETPAYFYKEKDGNLVAIVNATDNSFITVVNATESQLKSIQEDQNFGLDTRPSMQLTLRLRGPKNHN
jgi:hypothetical protein